MKRLVVLLATLGLLIGALGPVSVAAADPTAGFSLSDKTITRGASYEGAKSNSGRIAQSDAKLLARTFGLPYVPITPTFPWLGPLGLVPLPSKWIIEFCEPIPTDHYPEGAADDPMVVFNLTDQVREQIQQSLYRLLVKRPSAFG